MVSLKSIASNFKFYEERINSDYAKFALSRYSGSPHDSGEWINVDLEDDNIEVQYKTEGFTGSPDDKTALEPDAGEERIKEAIKSYL